MATTITRTCDCCQTIIASDDYARITLYVDTPPFSSTLVGNSSMRQVEWCLSCTKRTRIQAWYEIHVAKEAHKAAQAEPFPVSMEDLIRDIVQDEIVNTRESQ
jgi:hypothetical protein